jgi:hypothetical protein
MFRDVPTAFGLILASVGMLLASATTRLDAQLTDSDRERLVGTIAADAQNLDAGKLPSLGVAKSQVLGKIDAIDRYLTAAATAENRLAWLTYLDLDPISTAITDDTSLSIIAREAVALRHRLIGTAPGLELNRFVQLRDSVEQLINAILFRDPEKSLALLANQLQTLTKQIEGLSENPSSGDIAAISSIVGLLASSRQAENTVAALRGTFGRPNVSIQVSESLIQQAVNQNIDQTAPVRVCILGTRIIGTATLNGVVSANLLPSSGSAQVQVSLAGNLVSNSTGYNGPVRLRTVGFGDVNVTRMLQLSDSGINMQPVSTDVQLSTEVRRIEHHMKLVRKIARKRVAQQKPLADRIALGKMRTQVGRLFAERTDEATAASPTALAEARPILRRLSLREPAQIWNSTDDNMSLDATFRRDDQLSTVVRPPPIGTDYEAAIQFHESVVNNALSPVLAGRTMTEAKLNELLESVDRLPATDPTVADGEPEPPFEIDFARLQPIVFDARDQSVRIGVRGTRFAQGRRELKRAMEITATYHRSQSDDGKIILVREAEIDVNFPGGRRLTVAQAGLRPTIKTKFDKVFPKTLLDRKLEVPSTSTIEPLRGRVFQPVLVDATDGWMTVALR